MQIRDLIEQIVALWQPYRQKVTVDKSDPVYNLVVNEFPEALLRYLVTPATISLEGSTGAGNITAAPWIALFDSRITTSATTGYYVVYLFSTDMSAVTLSLAFGTTQFRQQFGAPSKAFPRMRAAAARIQEMFSHLIPPNLERGPIDLRAKPAQSLHYSYQQAAILSYAPYQIGALPEEPRLVAELQALMKIYSEIVSDPLDVTVERLVEAVVEGAPRVETIEMHDFVPRPPQTHRSSTGSNSRQRRYSPESRKVGDAGERVVVLYEQQRLRSIGRSDLADRVRWHGPEREFCGWDITSFDDDGNEIFVEVKSGVGKAVLCIDLTVNEWTAACNPALRDRYYIYIVTNALSAVPSIERMQNPVAFVKSRQITCSPIVYELRLRSAESERKTPV